MCDALVSVIVPVYRNPQWVEIALNSALSQTWKNLEILLVDDGSPDGCDAVCDRFAAMDSRVKVIHQQNSGVSVARNAALKIATGDYITFLDSDDFLSEDHIASMVNTAKLYQADIVSNRMFFYLDEFRFRPTSQCDTVKTITQKEAVVMMHSEKESFNGYLMNKLFRREILDGLFFNPAIAIHEDMLFIWDAVLNSKVIVSQDKYTYHYLFHETSAVHSYSSRFDSAVTAAEIMLEKMRNHFPEFDALARKTLLFALLSVANKRYAANCLDTHAFHDLSVKVKKHHSSEAFSYMEGRDNRISYRALCLGRGVFFLWKKLVSILKR